MNVPHASNHNRGQALAIDVAINGLATNAQLDSHVLNTEQQWLCRRNFLACYMLFSPFVLSGMKLLACLRLLCENQP